MCVLWASVHLSTETGNFEFETWALARYSNILELRRPGKRTKKPVLTPLVSVHYLDMTLVVLR